VGRQCTVAVVSEQAEPYAIGIYCDPCARRSGRRRLLAVAQRNPATFGGWDIAVARRAGRAHPGDKPVGNDGGVPHGDFPEPALTAPGKRLRLIPISPLESATQLVCRRKVPKGERPHRPRMARTRVVELAEQAAAAGRRDAYA
jgi:hypothetical protein